MGTSILNETVGARNEFDVTVGWQLDADLDCLSEEAFSQDLPVDEVTWPEDAMRAATGGSQGLRPPNVSRDEICLFRRIWPR